MSITKLAEVTVGAGGAASIDFTSIPGTYTDLMIQFSLRSSNSAATGPGYLTINGASTNRSGRLLYGSGSSTGSSTLTDHFLFDIDGSTATASTFTNSTLYIPNYAGSTNKSISGDSVNENNATAANQYLFAGLWSNTAAITSLSLLSIGYNLVQYSTATLYGITKGSNGVTVS